MYLEEIDFLVWEHGSSLTHPTMLERALEKLAKTFKIEQRIDSTEDTLTLVTDSYIGKKVIYTHELDLLPLLEEMKKRL